MSNVTPLEKRARKLEKTVRRAAPPEGFDPEGRRIIVHENGQLPAILDQAEIALAEAPELNLFRHAGRLARVHHSTEPVETKVRRPAGSLMIFPVEAPHLVELLGRAARHEKYDSRTGAMRPCDVPRRIADSFLARGHWPRLPDLIGFIEAPTVTLDGRLICEPGYHDETGMFNAAGDIPGFVRPLEKPSFKDARRALERLRRLFDTFPFVDEADAVAMIAGIITALERRILPAAPLFAMSAPSPGSGKTLLCESLAIIATNRRASVMSLGHDDAEFEKRLGGVLLAGDAVIAIDNIERPLRGDLICQVATQQFVRIRPLGGSGMLNVPTHALLVATGNNLAIIGDLKRRVLMVRLDAHTERPEQRSFERDHLAEMQARRGEIIHDALTIVLAYLAAGAPKIHELYGYGGFEAWDKMVRRPLVWLGCPDPLLTAEALREADPDLEAMRALFVAWRECRQITQAVTAAEVVAAAGGSDGKDSGLDLDLREALQVVCSEKINSRRLGNWLRAHRDKIVDGLQLRQAGSDGHAKVARWQVVTAAGSAVSAGSVSLNA